MAQDLVAWHRLGANSGCQGCYLITCVGGATICQKFLNDVHLALDSSSQEGLWLHRTLLTMGQAQGWGSTGVQERGQHTGPLPFFPREVSEWQSDPKAGLWMVQPLS